MMRIRYLSAAILFVAIALCIVYVYPWTRSRPSHDGPTPTLIWRAPPDNYGCEVVCTSPKCFAVLSRHGTSSIVRSVSCSGVVCNEIVLARKGICTIAGGSGRLVAVNNYVDSSDFAALCVNVESDQIRVLGRRMLFVISANGNAYPLCPYGPYALVTERKNRTTSSLLKVVNRESGAKARDIGDVNSYWGEHIRWRPGCGLRWYDPQSRAVRDEKGTGLTELSGQLGMSGKMETVLSPDATKAAVFATDPGSAIDVSIVDMATGRVISKFHRMVRGCSLECIRWSPDSSAIAACLIGGNGEGVAFFYVFRIKGSGSRVMLSGWRFFGTYSTFDWFPDSKRLVLGAYRDSGKQNAVVLVDTRQGH